jgi:cyclophilin family peptidyl-prolyl cis-trans isomerase/HEAT repeat protein
MRQMFVSMTFVIVAAGCATLPFGKKTPPSPAVYGMTVEEEATILRLEDRREFDPAISTRFLTHENPLHRSRMALALGRIGPLTFEDTNGNGVKDAGELQAGVTLLRNAAGDSSFEVRRNVAFALGEIGDAAGSEALLKLTADEHADVAAEAVEALSKLGAKVPFASYSPLTRDAREAVRGRAIRFLFRFASDEAQGVAAAYVASTGANDRREAVYSLSRRAYAPARTRLELVLTDPDQLTRSYAARALGIIGDSASLQPLLAAIADPYPWVRTNAARAIGQVIEKNPDAVRGARLAEDVSRVLALAIDPDPGTRVAGIDAIAAYAKASPAAKDRLTELAVSGDSVQREVATGAISRLFGMREGSPLPTLLETDSPWIKTRALESSGADSDGIALRQRLAGDRDPLVRSNAISAIADADAEMTLIRAGLADNDVIVRATAIDKFASAKNVSLDEKLSTLRAAEQKAHSEASDDARLSAITSIAALEFPERETYLRSLLTDRDPVVRRVAADSIETQLKLPRPQYTPLPGLAEAAADPSFYANVVQWSHQPHSATIRLQRGNIYLTLLPLEAPITSWNFANLARKGYFNGTTFMRVVPNFVIQGGDPRNDMSGGPGYAIRDEINLQKYTRGAVGMALSGPDTGGSQFFITHSPQHHLDGGYTIFGRVAAGMDEVADKVERGDRVETIVIDEVVKK